MSNLNYRFVVSYRPIASPGDYYNVESNTISDIIGIFRSMESVNLFISEHQELKGIKISRIVWEE